MSANLQSVIASVLPTLASALVSPLAGLAVAGVSRALGLSDSTVSGATEAIASALTDPESLLKLRELEAQLQKMELDNKFRFAELQYNYERLRYEDVASARTREASVRDSTNRILAFAVVGTFLVVVPVLLFGEVTVDQALAGTLIGYLSAKGEQVLGYYFGSTAGSRLKTELLADRASKPPKSTN